MISVSVIIPANNEEAYIEACLDALRAQSLDFAPAQACEVIVAANACTDATVSLSNKIGEGLIEVGWRFKVLDIPEPGKLNALNQAERVAQGEVLIYLDADVLCEPTMIRSLFAALTEKEPRYASGHLRVAPAKSWITRYFARVWQQLPFMTTNVQGAGLFAVNRSGRARWGEFPDIIADDGYVRLMFTPNERIQVSAVYHWPLAEGFSRLVKVRRRQDQGVRQLMQRFPEIMKNESKPPMTLRNHLELFLKLPVSYLVYVSVILMVKAGRQSEGGWDRGR